MRKAVALAGVFAGLALLPAAAAACPKTSVVDLEDEVMCLECGTPLALATESPQAKRQRAFILSLVESCRSKEEVKAALVAEFGEGVLAEPGDEGFDLAALLVPVLLFSLAGAGIAVGAVRWRRRSRLAESGGPPSGGGSAAGSSSVGGTPGGPVQARDAAPPSSGSDSARLDADLDRYDL